ncbi:MAG: HDOD domain-containing protein [Verrucomicrobia bacterium]|nr:HDOD domain-containing protein [Verrucomicrobiota bacterium]
MANILLVDPNELARLTLRGILERGRHRLAVVATADEAWAFVQRVVKVDVVFSELKVGGGGGLSLVQRLKQDSFRKLLPFVFYTEHGDRDAVKKALELRVQNFLIKPYQDELIYTEIAKATANPWRPRHFEEEKSFCKLMGFEPKDLHRMLEDLRAALLAQRAPLEQSAELKADKAVRAQLTALSEQAEAAGAWGVVEALTNLGELVVAGQWSEFVERLEMLTFADQLIFRHLNPTLEVEEFLTTEEADASQNAANRTLWFNAPAEGRCPVVTIPQLHNALDALTGCPVVDSAAASFQMSATGEPACISPLMDKVDKDPGLAAQMLIAANHLRRQADDGSEPIDDPRLAVGRLGELRLVSQARALQTVPERQFQVSPQFNWPKFWTYQNGVARLARNTCRYMEFHDLEAVAYTAGLLHDLGKLLLARIQPVGFHAVLEYARLEKVPLREAERKFLGCTTADLAVHFAEKHHLPRRFVNVMRWIDQPEQATEDIELVAVVSLARDFCRHNHLGHGGDAPLEHFEAIEESAEWRVLRERVFPAFNLRKFELQAHADCHDAKLSLFGRVRQSAVA